LVFPGSPQALFAAVRIQPTTAIHFRLSSIGTVNRLAVVSKGFLVDTPKVP
jgi:hypothetical protein